MAVEALHFLRRKFHPSFRRTVYRIRTRPGHETFHAQPVHAKKQDLESVLLQDASRHPAEEQSGREDDFNHHYDGVSDVDESIDELSLDEAQDSDNGHRAVERFPDFYQSSVSSRSASPDPQSHSHVSGPSRGEAVYGQGQYPRKPLPTARIQPDPGTRRSEKPFEPGTRNQYSPDTGETPDHYPTGPVLQQYVPPQSVYPQPMYQQPVHERPAYPELMHEHPLRQHPLRQHPLHQQPAYQAPAHQQPVYQRTGYRRPPPSRVVTSIEVIEEEYEPIGYDISTLGGPLDHKGQHEPAGFEDYGAADDGGAFGDAPQAVSQPSHGAEQGNGKAMKANKARGKHNDLSERAVEKKNQMPKTSEREVNSRDRGLGVEGKQADEREKKQHGNTAGQAAARKPKSSKLASFFSRGKKADSARGHGVASDSFTPESWRVPTNAESLEAKAMPNRSDTLPNPATANKAADPSKPVHEPHALNGGQGGVNSVNGHSKGNKTAGINSGAGRSTSANMNNSVRGPYTSDKLSGWVDTDPAPSTGNNAARSSREPASAGPTADNVGLGINLGWHMHPAGNITNKQPANTRFDQITPTTSNNAQRSTAPGPTNNLLSSAALITRKPLPSTSHTQPTPSNAGQSMNSHGTSSGKPDFPTPIHGKPLSRKGVEFLGASSQASRIPTTSFPQPVPGKPLNSTVTTSILGTSSQAAQKPAIPRKPLPPTSGLTGSAQGQGRDASYGQVPLTSQKSTTSAPSAVRRKPVPTTNGRADEFPASSGPGKSLPGKQSKTYFRKPWSKPKPKPARPAQSERSVISTTPARPLDTPSALAQWLLTVRGKPGKDPRGRKKQNPVAQNEVSEPPSAFDQHKQKHKQKQKRVWTTSKPPPSTSGQRGSKSTTQPTPNPRSGFFGVKKTQPVPKQKPVSTQQREDNPWRDIKQKSIPIKNKPIKAARPVKAKPPKPSKPPKPTKQKRDPWVAIKARPKPAKVKPVKSPKPPKAPKPPKPNKTKTKPVKPKKPKKPKKVKAPKPKKAKARRGKKIGGRRR